MLLFLSEFKYFDFRYQQVNIYNVFYGLQIFCLFEMVWGRFIKKVNKEQKDKNVYRFLFLLCIDGNYVCFCGIVWRRGLFK